MKRFAKSVVALVAALGLLALMANPSAASSGVITGGTLSVNMTTALTITLGGTGTCAASTITATDSSTGFSDSSSLYGTFIITITQAAFVYSGANYVFAGTISGTFTSTHTSGASGYAVASHQTMTNGVIRAASTTDICSSTGTTRCPAIGVSSLNSAGTANLIAVHPGPVGALHIATGAGTVSGFCTAPFSALNGKTVTLASITGYLV